MVSSETNFKYMVLVTTVVAMSGSLTTQDVISAFVAQLAKEYVLVVPLCSTVKPRSTYDSALIVLVLVNIIL